MKMKSLDELHNIDYVGKAARIYNSDDIVYCVVSMFDEGARVVDIYNDINIARALDGSTLTSKPHFVLECKAIIKYNISVREIIFDEKEEKTHEKL